MDRGAKGLRRGVLAALALLAWHTPAAELPEAAGYIMKAEGAVFVTSRGQTLEASLGQAVLQGMTLSTGASGALGVTLSDGTRFSMGPGSELILTDYRFDPAREALRLQARFERGTLSLRTGEIARLSPEAVWLETPHGAMRVLNGAHVLLKVAP